MERIKMEPGIYPGMSYDEYFKIDAVNNSLLRLIADQSPRRAKHLLDNPKLQTDAQRIGIAYHMGILEPEKFKQQCLIMPSFALNTTVGKQAFQTYATELALKKTITIAQCDEMVVAKKDKRDLLTAALAASGKTILDQSDLDTINGMYEELKQRPAFEWIQGGEAEVVIVWDDEVTGVRCKAKLDYLRREDFVLADLKSSMAGDYINVSPKKFQKVIVDCAYDQQSAFYHDGYQALTGDDCHYMIIAQEKEAPYVELPYEVWPDTVDRGRVLYRKLLAEYKMFVGDDVWPGCWVEKFMDRPGHFNRGEVEYINASDWALKDAGVGPF